MNFIDRFINTVEDEYWDEIENWTEEQNKKSVEHQKSTIMQNDPLYSVYISSWKLGFPYTGAIGGQYTYSVTPNSIGTTLKIKNNVTGDVLDLTDYASW